MSLTSLPPELLSQILSTHSMPKSARLTCRSFNLLLTKSTFSVLRTFINNPELAVPTLESTVTALPTRCRAIWSPHCSVPEDLPVSRDFLLATYAALQGDSLPIENSLSRIETEGWTAESSSEDGSSDEEDYISSRPRKQWIDDSDITVTSILRRLERNDLSEDVLRQAMFRYALLLSYQYKGAAESPQLWVMSRKQWANRI